MATSKALIKPQETYSNAKFVFTTKTKKIFNPLKVRQMMEINFIEPGGKNIDFSIEDQRFVKKLLDNIQQKNVKFQNNDHDSKVTATNLELAEQEIIKSLQSKHFRDKIMDLKDSSTKIKKMTLKKVSSLYCIDPFLDSFGILRIGGRIKRVNLSDVVKHLVILPRRNHITNLLIGHYHQAVNHMERGITYNHIRQNGSSAVLSFISKCVLCKHLRSPPQKQKMSDLPTDRLQEEPPFTYSGVGLFGPFYIKGRRSILKRYGVMFTTLSCRAVHLESTASLDTNFFDNALRRFLAHHGSIIQLRSDCGSNIVGARNEFQQALAQMHERDQVRNYLLKYNCDWIDFKFNDLHLSHTSGAWKR